MDNNKLSSINEKLRDYDSKFKQLTDLGISLAAQVSQSIKENESCIDKFVPYIDELNSNLKPFIEKYESFKNKVSELNNKKAEYAKAVEKAARLYEEISNPEFFDIASLKNDLESVIENLDKIRMPKNMDSLLRSVNEGISVVAKYFSLLKAGLNAEFSLSSELANINSSKSVSDISSINLEMPAINLEENKQAMNNIQSENILASEKGLESKLQETTKSNLTEGELLDYIIKSTIIEELGGIRISSIVKEYGNESEAIISSLKSKNFIQGKGTLKLSDEYFEKAKNEIISEINSNPKLSQENILAEVSKYDKISGVDTKTLIKTLCSSPREQDLLKYNLNILKNNNKLIRMKAIIKLPSENI